MIRTVLLAALGAAAVAAPAGAAESIHVSTVGKTPEQIRTDVRKAAEQVCRMTFDPFSQVNCVRETMIDALAQTRDPAVMKVAQR